MTHVLACALYCDPSSPDDLNGAGRFLADAILFVIGAAVVLGLLTAIIGALANLGKNSTSRKGTTK